MEAINKRITYSYLDFTKGLLRSYIDVDLKKDDTNEVLELSREMLQMLVKRKWENEGYKNGDADSVEQLYID